MERAQLDGLLRRVETFRTGAGAVEDTAERRRLEREREKLAKKEAAAAAKLAQLRADLDRTTEELTALARRQRIPGLQGHVQALSTQLRGVLERRPSYAEYAEPGELSRVLRSSFDDYVDRARDPKCRTCGQVLSSEMAMRQHDALALEAAAQSAELSDAERVQVAEAILAAGRRRRGEAAPPNIRKFPRGD